MIAIWAVAVRFFRAIKLGFREPAFRGLLYLTSIVVGSGTFFYRTIEDWSWLDSFYFTVITLTTVGYGDLAPVRSISKIFTIVIVLMGIGLLVTLIERIARYAVEDHESRQQKKA
ncbi:MAG: potassium channel family protein [Gemmatimonadota bacterium]|nr:potassium channel family protein [Gemmatimonadota bacterium]